MPAGRAQCEARRNDARADGIAIIDRLFRPTSLRLSEPTLRTVVNPASSIARALPTAVIAKKLSVYSRPR